MGKRRRASRPGLRKTSIQLSPLQIELLGQLSQSRDLSVSALISEAINEKLERVGLLKPIKRPAAVAREEGAA